MDDKVEEEKPPVSSFRLAIQS
jgi:hypothetical protein